MSVFERFDAILAIKRNQWREYAKQWRGIKPAVDIGDREKAKKAYIRRYIDENLEEFDELKFLDEFYDKVRKPGKFQNAFLKSVLAEWDDLADKLNYYTNVNIDDSDYEDYYEDRLEYILSDKDNVAETSFYQEELNDAKYEYLDNMTSHLEDIANAEFESAHINDTALTELKKVNVFNVYKGLFERLASENELNTKYRVYLPIEITSEDIASSSEKNTKANPVKLSLLSYAMHALLKTYLELKNRDAEEFEALEDMYYGSTKVFIANILDGYYIEPHRGRKERIGKILQFVKKYKPDWEFSQLTLSKLEKMFIDRPAGFKGYICISRHPHDIAAMSTDRGWTSCMDLNKTESAYTVFVGPTIMNAGLIAYLIKGDDIKINNPTSRLLLKSYIKENEIINYENPNWVLVVSDTYGTVYEKFTKMVQKWANDNWNYIVGDYNKKYQFNRNFYFENDDSNYTDIGKLSRF